nr:extracellular solute-binding protein [uncultured Cohaesibacter sp.]
MKQIILATMLAAGFASPVMAEDISLGRFFGACENAGSDTKTSVGEPCIIQSIINAASEQIDGVTVNTLPTDWGNYYDQLKAAYAGKTPPNVHVMHRYRVAEFAGTGALADLTDDLAGAGIDVSDWEAAAKAGVTYNGKIYGVPMDFHANLWHVNMDIMQQAGLVKDGKPVLPTSVDELMAQAKLVKEKTGKEYLIGDFSQYETGVRVIMSLIWQQGADLYDGDKATVNTPEAKTAIKVLTDLFAAGYADPKYNYTDSQQAFLNGEGAILINGTWVVDYYDAQAADPAVALKNYYAATFPILFKDKAAWAGSHMWAIPAMLKQNDPAKYAAALKVLTFINDHDGDWARTGHMAVRKSVLASDAYKALPHRTEYATTAGLARTMPPSKHYGAIQDTLNREFQAIWLTNKDVDAALSDAELDIQDLLDR